MSASKNQKPTSDLLIHQNLKQHHFSGSNPRKTSSLLRCPSAAGDFTAVVSTSRTTLPFEPAIKDSGREPSRSQTRYLEAGCFTLQFILRFSSRKYMCVFFPRCYLSCDLFFFEYSAKYVPFFSPSYPVEPRDRPIPSHTTTFLRIFPPPNAVTPRRRPGPGTTSHRSHYRPWGRRPVRTARNTSSPSTTPTSCGVLV